MLVTSTSRGAHLTGRIGACDLGVIWLKYRSHATGNSEDMGDRGRGRGWYYKQVFD
jgi:hypothetical protein